MTVSASAIGRKETTVRQLKKSIMETDWKKKYEEALSKARAEYENARKQGYTWLMGLLEGMFPDLKESEGAKIRNTGWLLKMVFRA